MKLNSKPSKKVTKVRTQRVTKKVNFTLPKFCMAIAASLSIMACFSCQFFPGLNSFRESKEEKNAKEKKSADGLPEKSSSSKANLRPESIDIKTSEGVGITPTPANLP